MSDLNIDVTLSVDPESNDGYPAHVVVSVDEARHTYYEEGAPERGECRIEAMNGYTGAYVGTKWYVELSCHTLDAWEDEIPPRYCPYCGKRVVDE